MKCFEQKYNLFELNRQLDIITQKIKDIGNPILYSDVAKIRLLDKKRYIIHLKIIDMQKQIDKDN